MILFPAHSHPISEGGVTSPLSYEIVDVPSIKVPHIKKQPVVVAVAVTESTHRLIDTPSLSHTSLMRQAGISASDYGYVEYVISHEDGWDSCQHFPAVHDCSYTGELACGIPQSYPCSKVRDACNGDFTDVICGLRWANTYVHTSHWGSWYAVYLANYPVYRSY